MKSTFTKKQRLNCASDGRSLLRKLLIVKLRWLSVFMILVCVHTSSFGQVVPKNQNGTQGAFTTPPTTFNIDGFLVRQVTGIGDWVDDVFDNNGNKVKPFAFHYIDRQDDALDNVFTGPGSNKTEENPTNWHWGNAIATDKGDLNHALVYIANDGTDTWGMFSADRKKGEGATTIQFEFLQKELKVNSTNFTFEIDPSTATTGGRTPGDILIALTFNNTNSIQYFRWTQHGTSYQYDEIVAGPNDAFVAVNSSSISSPYPVFGTNQYDEGTFIEGAINISKLLNSSAGVACSSASYLTLFIKAQTGAGDASELADFVNPIPFKFNVNAATIDYGEVCNNASDKTIHVQWGAGSVQTGSFSSQDLPANALNTANGDVDITGVAPGIYHIDYQYTNSCSEQKTVSATLTINAAPAAPNVGPQAFCSNTPTVADLPQGNGLYRWYAAATGGNPLDGTTALSTNTYYVSEVNTKCESGRTAVSVTLGQKPNAPTVTTSQTFCSAASPKVGDLQPQGTGIQWYDATTNALLNSTDALSDGGTYYVTQTSSGCESLPSSTVTVSLTADNTITLSSAKGTDAQTVCINTAITAITYTTTGVTGISGTTGLPAGVSAGFANNTITISGTPTVSGSFSYTVTPTGGCANNNITGSITVQAYSAAPIITASICEGATSVSGTSSEAAGTAITIYNGTTPVGTSTVVAGTPNTWTASVSALSAGAEITATATASGKCESSASASVTVKANNTVTLSSANGTDAQTTCVNTAITPITYTTTGVTGISSATGLPAGVSAGFANNTITISGTPTASGSFSYTVTPSGGCGSAKATGSITVQSYSDVPVITGQICEGATSVSGTSSELTGTSIQVFNGSTSLGTTTVNNGAWTLSGISPALASGNVITAKATASGECTSSASASVTVTGNGTINLTSSSTTNAQTLCVNTAITNITYSVGGTSTSAGATGLPTGVTGAFSNGVFTISGTPSVPGTYNYTVTTTGSACTNPSATGSITVNPNGICTFYYGDYFANTGSTSTGGFATVTLVYNISTDPNAACKTLTGLAASDFSIATDPDANVQSVSLVSGSKTYSNGVLSAKYTITLKSTAYSGTVLFTLSTVSGSDFSITGSCSDNPLVTVSSKTDGFVTGGGFILPSNSGGTIGGTSVNGLKNNFGFNVKFNKAGKLQGNWNTIIRRREGNSVVSYQVKSNVASTLVVKQDPVSKKYRADITYTSANFQNLTCPLCTVNANNGTVVVTVWDIAEPGAAADSILISIRDRNNNLWYTSNLPGSHNSVNADVQLLNQGNIQIHILGYQAPTSTVVQPQAITQLQTQESILDLKALPNPTKTAFNVQVVSENSSQRIQLRVMDITGRTVQVLDGLSAGQTIRVGATYRPGMYIIEMIQGDRHKQLKLLKQPY